MGAVYVTSNDALQAVAQVMVDEAFWTHTVTPDRTLSRLLVTSNGITFDHEIAVAAETPRPDAGYFLLFALVGLYRCWARRAWQWERERSRRWWECSTRWSRGKPARRCGRHSMRSARRRDSLSCTVPAC